MTALYKNFSVQFKILAVSSKFQRWFKILVFSSKFIATWSTEPNLTRTYNDTNSHIHSLFSSTAQHRVYKAACWSCPDGSEESTNSSNTHSNPPVSLNWLLAAPISNKQQQYYYYYYSTCIPRHSLLLEHIAASVTRDCFWASTPLHGSLRHSNNSDMSSKTAEYCKSTIPAR